MHIAETFGPTDTIPKAKVITFEGEARSGKGTSVRAVYDKLIDEGRNVVVIDQGQKFRVLAKLAHDKNVALQDQAAVTQFLRSPDTRPAMLELLGSLVGMEQDEVNALLYTQEVSTGSAQVAQNADAHPLAVGLLFDQVQKEVENGADTILIDGRSMEKYGRQMAEQKKVQFVLGFYFRCDASIAARRTTGIFVDMDAMSTDEKLRLLEAITKIGDRNRQDTLRDVDPMLEPANAYPLHAADFLVEDRDFIRQATLDALLSGMVSMNTSYTRSVEEMTEPVVALATRALALHDKELERFTNDPKIWSDFSEFDDPRRSIISHV
jgi:cytidylate kinase